MRGLQVAARLQVISFPCPQKGYMVMSYWHIVSDIISFECRFWLY
jgi:hypothetical protein